MAGKYLRLVWDSELLTDFSYVHVDRVVRNGMSRGLGIHGLRNLYERAARGLYHPKNFTEEDNMRQLLNWRIGGIQMVEIAHRNSELPGMTTIRRRTTVPTLTPSPSTPKAHEIEANIKACFSDELRKAIADDKVVHQILMLDEIAMEKRPQWYDKSNMFLGICREHGHKTALKFCSEKDLETLFKDVDEGKVHLATEVSTFHKRI